MYEPIRNTATPVGLTASQPVAPRMDESTSNRGPNVPPMQTFIIVPLFFARFLPFSSKTNINFSRNRSKIENDGD